jgi:hypothetical protein
MREVDRDGRIVEGRWAVGRRPEEAKRQQDREADILKEFGRRDLEAEVPMAGCGRRMKPGRKLAMVQAGRFRN